MAKLSIYDQNSIEDYIFFDDIKEQLELIGVNIEQWTPIDGSYSTSIRELIDQYGFQSADVVESDVKLREYFLKEHTHDDFEARFFEEGSGLFYLHVDDKVYLVLCEAGELITVPPGVTHWFDMGENPCFKCVRFFTIEDGWQATFTDSDISSEYPTYDEYVR